MIRPFTCVCLLLAAGSGLYVYQSKHRVQVVDREITRTLKLADAAHERVAMLRAEWALLNEPDRLQDLASRFLNLRPMAPTQFVAFADLTHRLPAPGAAIVAPPPLPDAPDPSTAPPPVAAADPRSVPPPKPASPSLPPAVQVAAKASVEKAAAVDHPHPRISAQQVAVRTTMPDTSSLPPSAADVVTRIARGDAASPPAPAVASALGAARPMLPAPVPVSTARAPTVPFATARDSP
jgi:hypothetical protein